MKQATLTRQATGDDGTFGEIKVDDFHCFTIELPWRQNKIGRSCIPAGSYLCTWRYSQRHGLCYHLEDVPGRTDVEIHSANFAGDSSMGMKVQLLGCIAPGRHIGILEGQRAMLHSKDALEALEDALMREPFQVKIAWSEGINPEAANEERKSAD